MLQQCIDPTNDWKIMDVNEVMAKWADKFYDPDITSALSERNAEMALGYADYLARRKWRMVYGEKVELTNEDCQDGAEAGLFMADMRNVDDENRAVSQIDFAQIPRDLEKGSAND